MEDLVRTRDIKLVHIKRELSPTEIEQRKAQAKKKPAANLLQPVSTWKWQLADKSNVSYSKGTKEEDKKVFGAEVGVGEDWSHLNKRRRRVRKEKVLKDVKWFERVQTAWNSDSRLS